MTQSQRITLYILVLIAGASWIFLNAAPAGAPAVANTSAPQAGFTAPDFTLKTPEGETYTLSELKGNAVLVNLWATWCPPCRAEMPAIQKMYDEYKDQGFVVLAVNSTVQDSAIEIPAFMQSTILTSPSCSTNSAM